MADQQLARYRTLKGPARWYFVTATWAGIALTIYYVFRITIAGMIFLDISYFALLLGIYLPLAFLVLPISPQASRDKLPWYDIVFAVACAGCPIFIAIYGPKILTSALPVYPPPFPMALALITWVLILEGVRRASGPVLTAVVGAFSVYPLFASHMPSILFAKSYSIQRLAGFNLLSEVGVFGIAWQVFGTLLMGFMVFGVALQVTGGAKFLLDAALGLVGRFKGAPALTAVVSSAMMASLSGSAVANVISTGSITIPAMKKMGYEPHVAGAIESVASTGGVLMPPVMGATAFIMAAFLRVPYYQVALAAAIPMVLYFTGLFAQVYFRAHRDNMASFKTAEIPPLKTTLKYGWFYFGSIIVLVYLLFWIKVESWAPFYGTLFLIFCAFLRKETRPNLATVRKFTVDVGNILAELAPMLASLGLLIGSMQLTGVGQSLAGELIKLAGGNLYLLLILGAIGGIILGTGMTMTPCYIFMAIIFVPSLVQLNVNVMSSHLFFLYWGMISFITPPVCISVYAASAIAGSKTMKTGVHAVRLGIVGFIIPFFFVLQPALVAQGSLASIVQAILTGLVGSVFIASAIEGYMFLMARLSIFERVCLAGAGLLLLYGSHETDLVGVGLVVLMLIAYLLRGGPKAKTRESLEAGQAQA